jgi:hypothetical protein
MTIQKLSVPLKMFPKPRGNLGKHKGKTIIYHSTPQYVNWKKSFKSACLKANFKPQDGIMYYCFKFYHKPVPGHPPDGENCQGSIQDALVENRLIRDDNINVISRWYGEVTKTDYDLINLYFCQTKKEFLYVIEKFMDN